MSAINRCLVYFAGLAALLLAFAAQAVPLNNAFAGENFLDTALPGTTAAARPELAGVVLEDVIQPFSFGALGISGTVQNRVVRETVAGTLDFYWRIRVDADSTGSVSAFRLGDFGFENLTDADWRSDGLGSLSPFVGRLFNPANRPDGAINFLFTDPAVGPGGVSHSFFLRTDATEYTKTATYDLLGGADLTLSGQYETFAPAIPEPSTYLLMIAGLLGLWTITRRRTR